MKTLLKNIAILALAIFLTEVTTAQALIEKTEAQKTIERLDASQAELINHIESQLNIFYATVNQDGKQQAILDVLGNKAAVALQRYATMRATLLLVKPSANVPAPDPTVFVINQDGTVTYVAPPAITAP